MSSALDLRILRFSDSPLRAGLAVSGVCQERFNTYSSYRRAQPATLVPQPIAHSPVAQPPSGAHVNSPWRKKVSSVFSSIRFTTHVAPGNRSHPGFRLVLGRAPRFTSSGICRCVSVVRAHARTRIPLSVACDPAVSHARFRWRSVSVGSGTMRPADGRAV